MSKSVLVINTPISCRDCIARSLSDDCNITNKSVGEHRYNKSKPDWCPLQDIPLKKNVRNFNISSGDFEQKGYQQGWNACIDEILGNSM